MAQRHTASGRKPLLVWLAIVLVLALAIVVAAMVFIIGPQQQLRQEAQGTAEARQAEVERLYAAGVAFQNASDWEAAEAEFKQVITLDPDYKDVQTRFAEVKAHLQETEATAQADQARATAIARMTATARAERTATAQAEATQTAKATAATATTEAQVTAVAAPTVTAEAMEAHYNKGLGYINMRRWEEAKAELEEVFDLDPNYKDVVEKLTEVETQLAKMVTQTPTPSVVYEPVTIQSICNYEFSTDIRNPPTGDQVFGGIPFSIPASGFNRFETQHRGFPSFPTRGFVTVSIPNPIAVHVLIAGGYVLPEFAGKQVGRIVLHFSDASTYEEVIIAGLNIREHWLGSGQISTMTDEHCQTVWQRGEALIDMCTIPLPESYKEKVLTGIAFQDTSATTVDSVDPCLMIGGVTVARNEFR
jgi:tetratricopeptide (TPR) repeat protein